MPGKPQFCNSLFRTISLMTAAMLFTLVFVPALAQNKVPPTARQAAASPAHFLAHPGAARPAPPPRRRASPLDNALYSNGPLNGDYDAFIINFGYIVSDSFTLTSASPVGSFDFYPWVVMGDLPLQVDWSVTSDPNGGTVYGGGTSPLVDLYLYTNNYNYDIHQDTVIGLNLNLAAGTYYLNLQNAVTVEGQAAVLGRERRYRLPV